MRTTNPWRLTMAAWPVVLLTARLQIPLGAGQAIRADAVGELCVGVASEVFFEFLPVTGIIADFLAPRADRQQAVKRLDLRQRFFEIAVGTAQLGLDPRP